MACIIWLMDRVSLIHASRTITVLVPILSRRHAAFRLLAPLPQFLLLNIPLWLIDLEVSTDLGDSQITQLNSILEHCPSDQP